MCLSREREDAAITEKYTMIFGVRVNKKGYISENSCRKINKQLNMT